ncbi:hypothetical protein EGT72_007160 [Acinetobacter johnsonii]|uniref:hypothetical protein n=1 Tax=Acinetobacter johnsonii TaxID=40214 RepID=UPI000F672AE3|nr:hypothetical protein [Acinetobacter johnsonii]QYA56411.1 hypothetical protein EGT72_007160 [Acinetobacter johnsonii]
MVASTDIKFFVHSNNNAPQLQNAYGSMIGVLDACLVNGISLGLVFSLTAIGTTVTAVFSTAHNLMQYQVLKIADANQAEYNGEHRILTVPNATSVTFQLASAPSITTATGTITASLPPLGWEKPFSSTHANGGGKAAYRSKNLLLPSRPFLRVVDEPNLGYNTTYAKYAKVGIVEDMTDIDTMLGVQAPFDPALPDKNWVGTGSGASGFNGWAKWFYALSNIENSTSPKTGTPPDGARSHVVIGNGDCFYILNRSHTSKSNHKRLCPYFFGSIDADYSKTHALAAVFEYTTNDTSVSTYSATAASISDISRNLILLRNLNLEASPVFCTTKSLIGSNIRSGYQNYIAAQNITVPVMSFDVPIFEGATPRGKLPLIEWLAQAAPYQNLAAFEANNELKVAVDCMAYEDGQVLFNVGVSNAT